MKIAFCLLDVNLHIFMIKKLQFHFKEYDYDWVKQKRDNINGHNVMSHLIFLILKLYNTMLSDTNVQQTSNKILDY